MRFQNLKQDKKILRLANGIVIESSICFGKQTSRVYVPPVPPVKKKVEEEENVLIVSAYQEYTDIPITWANGDTTGSIYIYTAIEYGGLWRKDDMIHLTWTDPDEIYGTAVLNGTVWTYTEHGETTWKMKFNTITNQWTFNVSDKYASPTGKYIIRASFNANSLATYYPRNYKTYFYPLETVKPGTYVMTVPYYKVEHTSEFNNTVYPATTIFGTGLTATDGETKTAIRTVWATVPIKLNAGFNKLSCSGNRSFYTAPWTEPESYLIHIGEWGYRCSPPRSAGTYEWGDFFTLPDGADNGQAFIDEGELTASADIEFYNGENTYSLTLRESHCNDAGIVVGYLKDMGTFTVGWHNYLSGWLNPPPPVPRTGLPPYRDIRETTAYVKATYNKVTGIPWYAPRTEWGVTCYNTAESGTISISGTPNVFASYED
jgi:hypothetical protein